MKSLIGKKAPAIRATAVVNGNEIVQDFTLGQYEGKKYVVLFFYPMDFTFVCPTELHAFQEKLGEFEARGVQVVGCSVDSEYSHLAWLGQPRNRGGIEGVKYRSRRSTGAFQRILRRKPSPRITASSAESICRVKRMNSCSRAVLP